MLKNEFQMYKQWCRDNSLHPQDAKSLKAYTEYVWVKCLIAYGKHGTMPNI